MYKKELNNCPQISDFPTDLHRWNAWIRDIKENITTNGET